MATIQSSSKKRKSKGLGENNKRKKKHQDLSDVRELGQQLLSSRAHINNLPLLLSFLDPTSSHPPEFILESLLSLQSFFTPLLPRLPSSSAKPTEDPESIYQTWVRSKFDEFAQILIQLSLSSTLPEEALREVVMDTLMECVKVGNAGKFHTSIYHKFIKSMVYSIEFDTLLNSLVSKYFTYIDVRYFTYISLVKIIRTLDVKEGSDVRSKSADSEKQSPPKASGEFLIRNIHHVISKIPPLEQAGETSEFEMWNASGVFTKESKTESKKLMGEKHGKDKKSSNDAPSFHTISKKLKPKFSKAWMSFLTLALPIDVYKEVLVTLHQAVIPYLSEPKLLCDFLTKSYDIGGVISVMALSSLFILMTEHGIDYPELYEKLYALLEPSIFIAKHRAKFFQDDNAESAKDEPNIKSGIDHFNNEEIDLRKTDAIRSSLWEIDTLRHHYCPPVSRFVLSLENDLTVRSKTMEVAVKDFSSGSYATIFREEIRRRVKQVPLAFYKVIPTSLFSDSDFGGWTFQTDGNKRSSE